MSSGKRSKTYPPTSKKAKVENDSESESDADSDSASETSDIQIDFSGFELAPCDFTGIKLLLNQLFVKADIDLSELSTHLIDHQLEIGTVIKDTEVDESVQNDDDTNEDDTVYALVSVVSLSPKNRDVKCVQQLRSYFSNLKKQSGTGTDQALSYISSILDDPHKTVGLIINERYSNLPSEVSVPSFTKLKNEIESLSSKDVRYQFTHYIMVCKLYKMQPGNKKKTRKTDSAITWCNPEEEIFDQEAEARYEFSVSKQIDSGISGSWTEDDVELLPFRRVLAFSAHKFDDILQKLSTLTE